MNRLNYLLDLQKHCESKGQRFSTKNTRELNKLLTKAYNASNLSGDEKENESE